MLILYNILQIILLILFLPLLLIYIATKAKYRKHIPKRLGCGLKDKFSALHGPKKTVWIHALSVGEVTSAQQLVARLRGEEKNLQIVFSASTSSGYALAKKRLKQYCDVVFAYPLDIIPIVSFFFRTIKPDLFILVETDFWPNILLGLERRAIPSILVNGRVSHSSYQQYKRFSYFFSPVFKSFRQLCVQTEKDRERLISLGVPNDKVSKLGNLKYEKVPVTDCSHIDQILQNCPGKILVAGSTHEGEEAIILEAYSQISSDHNIHLVIAPRNIERTSSLVELSESFNFATQLHTDGMPFQKNIYIIDTIGDLTSFYARCDISIVGGSLINEGGHNPLEPANFGKPVLFGPYMTDFLEISKELLRCGGGIKVATTTELISELTKLIELPGYLEQHGRAAEKYSREMGDVIDKHIELIKEYI